MSLWHNKVPELVQNAIIIVYADGATPRPPPQALFGVLLWPRMVASFIKILQVGNVYYPIVSFVWSSGINLELVLCHKLYLHQ